MKFISKREPLEYSIKDFFNSSSQLYDFETEVKMNFYIPVNDFRVSFEIETKFKFCATVNGSYVSLYSYSEKLKKRKEYLGTHKNPDQLLEAIDNFFQKISEKAMRVAQLNFATGNVVKV